MRVADRRLSPIKSTSTAGGRENGKSDEQSLATVAASECPALLGVDPQGKQMPIPGGEGPETVLEARQYRSRRADGQPERMEARRAICRG